ncbi:MAG: glycosyltransferase, partial [Actinobacteria bacterium]|nr:glycosyltransferase [Actinomycetota bacterium]
MVPTRNEEGSIPALLSGLAESLDGIPAEVLFVDDSADGTPRAIRQAAREYGLAVRLLHRPSGARQGGLGGAVVAGLKHARGSWAVVMDGDLQHPPQLVAKLVQVGQARNLDLVAGSRYTGAGASDGLGGGYRRAVSGLTTRLTKAVFPRRLSRLSDPMSGFFAVRLAALDLDRLDPIGFKILLELMIRQPRLQVAEVPFVFGTRFAGQSKASPAEGLRFLRHLLRLRLLVLRTQVRRSSTTDGAGRLARLAAFGAVGASGVLVNTAALWLFSEHVVHPHYLIAAVLATEVSTSWNFVLTEKFVFRGPKPGTVPGRGVRFFLLNHLALLPRLPLLALMVEVLSANLLVANVLTLALLFLVRFVVADSAIYAKPDGEVVDKQPMRIAIDLTGMQRPATGDRGPGRPAQHAARPVSPGSR